MMKTLLDKRRVIDNERSLLPVVYCLMPIIIFSSCSVSKTTVNPSKKYTPERLAKDYSVFRGALEESHPGIYWYTPKEEMDNYFAWGENQLKDSLNEEQF